jgi:RHS repeat-associated protein
MTSTFSHMSFTILGRNNTQYDPSSNVLHALCHGDGCHGGRAKPATEGRFKTGYFETREIRPYRWSSAVPRATYRGYNTTGTSYTQATVVTGDIIVAQSIPTYDEAGNTISQASFDRLNNADPTVTGALTSSNARISYTAAWFDGIDRPLASANYGAISSFTRPDTPPASSATVLVSSTTYDQAGRVYQTTDPNGIINQPSYDNASRTIQTIEDVGGIARTTNFAYTLDNQIATLTAKNPVTGDQITTYLYGTTLADSGVARNDLLRYTIYPDANEIWPNLSVDGWASMTVDDWAGLEITSTDSVGLTYNRLGEQASITDQRGTVRTFYRDALGRLTNDCVSTVGDDTDGTVLQIATTYEVRGMVESVTSLDNATPGSGDVLNQTWSTYNTFGQLIKEQQEHTGTVTTGSVSVGYAYDTGASSSNEIRLNQLIYPNGRLIDYSYAARMDSALNRVTSILDDATSVTFASYTYLGMNSVVRITYPEPGIWLDLWGGTSGTFAGLDQFNRIIDQRWQNSITTTPVDIDRYQYGYDQNSNRLWKANVVGTAAIGNLDEGYTYDTLNRLTQMQRGTLSGGTITGTPTVQQTWSLDPVGNWSTFATAASGTTNLNQQRTDNTVNEITAITETAGPTWITPAYDPAGNTTTMPQVADPTQSFTAVYDAWNRMTSISDVGGTVGTYTYDGRNRRMAKTTASETRHFYWTNGWQDVEERIGTATTDDKQYVWGIRYIDEIICRLDATSQVLYACQDTNFNLMSINTYVGDTQQRFLYDPYGNSSVLSADWTITTDAYFWMRRFAGQEFDFECQNYNCRNRLLHPSLGQFAQRDPLMYSAGTNLYLYVASNPVNNLDPMGLHWERVFDQQASCVPTQVRQRIPGGRGTGSSGKGCAYKTFCRWDCTCPSGYNLDPQYSVSLWPGPCNFSQKPGWFCFRWIEVPEPQPQPKPISIEKVITIFGVVIVVIIVCVACPECCLVGAGASAAA